MNRKPSTGEKELAPVEKCIIRTMRKFRESPKSFWSEDDISCHLKQLLLKGRLFRTGRFGSVFLSYPTKNTYGRREDGALIPSASGKREYFDLAGWMSRAPATSSHLTQGLSFAIELKYLPALPEDWPAQIRNDLMKLSDETNAIPRRGRFFLLLTTHQTPALTGRLNILLAEFPSVRCYQQVAQ